MPIYRIRFEQEYTTREVMDLDIEAANEEAARVEAQELINDDALDENDWSEVDGRSGEVSITSVVKTSESNDVIITS